MLLLLLPVRVNVEMCSSCRVARANIHDGNFQYHDNWLTKLSITFFSSANMPLNTCRSIHVCTCMHHNWISPPVCSRHGADIAASAVQRTNSMHINALGSTAAFLSLLFILQVESSISYHIDVECFALYAMGKCLGNDRRAFLLVKFDWSADVSNNRFVMQLQLIIRGALSRFSKWMRRE